MIKKILVAYDHGLKAQKALEIATEIARGCGAEVYIFTSVKMPGIIDSYAARDMLKELETQSYQYFEKILEEAAAKVRGEGLTAHVVIRSEGPGEAIVRFAEKENIDLVALGSNNRGSFERFLLGLGSVSNYVVQRAKCPVLISKV
jgi:nucleotide-binding universal stress UspA family protein